MHTKSLCITCTMELSPSDHPAKTLCHYHLWDQTPEGCGQRARSLVPLHCTSMHDGVQLLKYN